MEQEILTTNDLDNIIYEVTVCSGSDKKGKLKLALAVDPNPNRNYGGDAYFKVYHGESYNKSKYVSRITFKEPVKYVVHKSTRYYKNLDKDQIDLLDELVRLPSIDCDFLGYTVWQELIYKFNRGVKLQDRVDENLPVSNFYNLL